MHIRTTALMSFQEQIPFKEDELSEAKLCEEFQQEVDKVLEELSSKTKGNKYHAKRLVEEEVNSSMEKYANAISSVFDKEPMAEPYKIRMQHETLQDLHISVPDSMADDLRSKCSQHFFEETDRIFQEQVQIHNFSANETLNKCFEELHQAAERFVGQDIAQIFITHKIPMDSIVQIQKSLNEQLEKVVEEIRDSTIANQEIAENIAFKKKLSEDETNSIPGTSSSRKVEDSNMGPLLRVNIRVLTGKTYKINAYSLWTVEMLRRKFMKCLRRDYKACSLCHKAKRLQNENTLQSYKIQDGDILIANI